MEEKEGRREREGQGELTAYTHTNVHRMIQQEETAEQCSTYNETR